MFREREVLPNALVALERARARAVISDTDYMPHTRDDVDLPRVVQLTVADGAEPIPSKLVVATIRNPQLSAGVNPEDQERRSQAMIDRFNRQRKGIYNREMNNAKHKDEVSAAIRLRSDYLVEALSSCVAAEVRECPLSIAQCHSLRDDGSSTC